MKLSQAIDSYLSKVKSELTDKTYRGYKGRLKTLREMHGERKVKDLKAKHITQWLDFANNWQKGPNKGQPKADNTIRLTVTAWEQLQMHMKELKLIRKDIFDFGKKPGGRKRTQIPTDLEQFKLYREARRRGRKEFCLMFRCLRLSGARPGELCKANIKNWDRDRNLIILKEHKTAKKTQRDRHIGVGRTMRRLLIQSIGNRTEGPIFVDEKGNRWKEEKLSRIYRALRDKLGFSTELVLYCARHEHGTKICRKHGIAAAQHSLGHADIHTTQRYVHPDPAQLAGYQDTIF
jgi:integrase